MSGGIIEFPGGISIYKDGKLVGAIGVSGDSVNKDEEVAKKGVKGFEPPEYIKIDSVTQQTIKYVL